MARSAASIQLEINALEAKLQDSSSLYNGVGADGVNASINREALERRLDRLYAMLDRANGGPMFVRGRVLGLN